MNIKSLIAAVLIATASLAGCKQENAGSATDNAKPTAATSAPSAQPVQHHLISLPALPAIRSAVFSLAPLFNGSPNPELMSQICSLAIGKLTQPQVDAWLRQHSIDPTGVPRTGESAALLVNGDRPGQMTACAAYLATSVMMAPNTRDFVKNVQVPVPAAKASGKSSGKPQEPKFRTEQQVDAEALARILPAKVAIVRANADVFALIATEMQRRPGLSVAEQREVARQLFVKLAPVYLQRVAAQTPAPGIRYQLTRLADNDFAFRGSDGSTFEFDGSSVRYAQGEMVWLGDSKILGQEFLTQVAYFDPSVNALLAAPVTTAAPAPAAVRPKASNP